MLKVRIIRIPPGEAPEEIRKEWVGVVIPLSECQPTQRELVRETKGIGGSKVPTNQIADGFIVDIADAIEALDKKSKKAANWWREWVKVNGLVAIFSQLVFAKDCGELVDA